MMMMMVIQLLSSRDNAGRYVAASRDGEIRFFNAQFDLQLSFKVEHPGRDPATTVSVWVTDMVCMLNVGVLAVACTPGFIAFYSAIATGIVHPIVVVDKLEICPSTVDYWSVRRSAASVARRFVVFIMPRPAVKIGKFLP